MFQKIDQILRTYYFKYFTGFSILFITVSPFSDTKTSREQKEEKVSEKMMSRFNTDLMNQFLGGDDAEATSGETPFNVYLTQAPSSSSFIPQDVPKAFIPVETNALESAGPKEDLDVLYGKLLNSYLSRVEELILLEKDYVMALKELDKMALLDPLHPKVIHLRKLLTRKIEERLQPPSGFSSSPTLRDTEIDIAKEKALIEAEAMLLRESLHSERPSRSYSQSKPESFVVAQETKSAEPSYSPESNRLKVAIEPLEETESVLVEEEIFQTQKGETLFEKVDTKLEKTQMEKFFQEEMKVEEGKKEAAPEGLFQNSEFNEILPEEVERFILRGKKYYRQGNFSLALISFSKARQKDTNQVYEGELKSLIQLTKKHLEKINGF